MADFRDFAQMKHTAGLERDNAALRAKVAELEAELAREREDSRDIPTIAYLCGAADWKRKAAVAEAERDEALARVEKLERLVKCSLKSCNCKEPNHHE